MTVIGTYNPYLVALSVAVACLASYTALDLGGRIRGSRRWARLAWLATPPSPWEAAFGRCTSSGCSPSSYRCLSVRIHIVGYSPDELVSRSVEDITHPDDLEFSFAQIERLRSGKADNYEMEKRYVRKDGTG
jgi:hypothetical protein